MSGAAYEVRFSVTDDETFEKTIEWKMEDGTSFPWSDYSSYDYELRGPTNLKLDQSSGITIDADQNLITFAAPNVNSRLRCGQYRHGCSITHAATGKVMQIFDGSVTVTEGSLRR